MRQPKRCAGIAIGKARMTVMLLWASSMMISACGQAESVPTQEDPNARATRIVQHRQEILTQVALSPVPTIAPYPTYAGPTPTLRLGIGTAPNGPGYRADRPVYINSWRGLVGGHMLTIAAGQQSEDTDREQGILVVYQGTRFDDTAPGTQVFLTPQRLGVVHIIAVQDGRVSLGIGPEQSTNPVFLFDLSTRQWLPIGTDGHG